MNSNFVNGNGGANIKPSARESIHRHPCCPFFDGEEMGRFGLKVTRNETHKTSPTRNEGRDEIDNVMSKFTRTPSPIPMRRSKEIRRNSVDIINQYTDDSNSEDSDSQQEITEPNDISMGSEHTSTCALNKSQSFQEFNGFSENNTSQFRNKSARINNKFAQIFIGLLGIATVVVAWHYANDDKTMLMINYDESMFNKDLNKLGERYRIHSNSILQIESGLTTISEKEDTGSFVFAYRSDTKGFDENKFNNFVNTVASISAKYLRNDSTSVRHITVDGSKLEMRSHAELIQKYREDISKSGVMLVRDVNNVPFNLAMAFHYYCDEYNPLAKKSAIFFTLDMAKCSNSPSEQQSNHANIEKCLTKRWSGVGDDNIRPLLTRVVNTVIDIS